MFDPALGWHHDRRNLLCFGRPTERADEQAGGTGVAAGSDRTSGIAGLEERPWGRCVCRVHQCDPDTAENWNGFCAGYPVATVAPYPTTTHLPLTLSQETIPWGTRGSCLPDLPLGQALFLAEPEGDMVFGLDPQGLKTSPPRNRRRDDYDGHDAQASRLLVEGLAAGRHSPPRVRCRGPGGRSWDQAS
jgi:hypothetical protein